MIPFKLKLARQLIQLWPFDRGRGRIERLILPKATKWPEKATFRFRYGVFVNTPISPWPQGYRDLFINGLLDVTEVNIWRRVLKAGDNVVDGGANYGYWSLVAASLVGKKGTVHAFEPVPSTYASLQENISASEANNVLSYRMALSDHTGKCAINLSENDPIGGQSSLRNRTDRLCTSSVEVQLDTLDETLHENPIRLIKLDVEGGELAALKGATAILSRKAKPVVTFEWNRATASAFGYMPEAIGDLLLSFGYKLFIVTPKGLTIFADCGTNGNGWVPMVWALTEQHRQELGI